MDEFADSSFFSFFSLFFLCSCCRLFFFVSPLSVSFEECFLYLLVYLFDTPCYIPTAQLSHSSPAPFLREDIPKVYICICFIFLLPILISSSTHTIQRNTTPLTLSISSIRSSIRPIHFSHSVTLLPIYQSLHEVDFHYFSYPYCVPILLVEVEQQQQQQQGPPGHQHMRIRSYNQWQPPPLGREYSITHVHSLYLIKCFFIHVSLHVCFQ